MRNVIYIYVLTLLLATYIRTYIRIRTVIYVTLPITSKQARYILLELIACVYGIVIIIMYTFVRGYLIFVVFNVYYICGFHLLLNFASDIVSVFPPRRACTLEIYRLSISI